MKYPIYTGTPKNTLLLVEDYTIEGIDIKAPFESDGLTLKVRFLKIFIDKFAPKFSPFFFLHDFLCRKKMYDMANDLGAKVLFKIEDSKLTRFGMFSIRAYHYFKYGA